VPNKVDALLAQADEEILEQVKEKIFIAQTVEALFS